MITDKEIAIIEKELIESRWKLIEKMPSDLRLQLKRIEDKVFDLWNLDNVFTYQIRLDCFDACNSSRLTLNQLESMITSMGSELSKKYDFDKALKRIVRIANKQNGKSKFSRLKKIVNGATSRNKN